MTATVIKPKKEERSVGEKREKREDKKPKKDKKGSDNLPPHLKRAQQGPPPGK